MKDIKNTTNTDLTKLILEKRDALRKLRFGTSGAATKNVKEARTMKKDIARIFTELSIRNKVAVK
jgi:ribosomal protein L29